MTFIWPVMLASLVLIPLFVGLFVWLQRRRNRIASKYGSLGFMQGAAGKRAGRRRYIPPIIFLAGLAILLIAMARPQMVVSLPRVEGKSRRFTDLRHH